MRTRTRSSAVALALAVLLAFANMAITLASDLQVPFPR
jgi:hypothetical protein